jgi:hypothetical protein
MSFRSAAELVRATAETSRRRAELAGIDEARSMRFRRYLQAGDIQALEAWLRRRVAQELDTVANELQGRACEDVTVLERKPGPG